MEEIESNVNVLELPTEEQTKWAYEQNALGRTQKELADHIELEFEFTDEEKIMDSIKKVQRKLGLLQDEEFKKMFSEFTSYQVKSYHENRKMILEEGRKYQVTFTKDGSQIGAIGTPNLEAMAKFIFRQMHEDDLSFLSADTQTTLFFNKFK